MAPQCRNSVGAVRDAFGVQRVDEAEVVHAAVDFREQFRSPTTAGAMLRELPRRFQKPLRTAAGAGVRNDAGVVEGIILPSSLASRGL